VGTPESILGEIIMRKFRQFPHGKPILWRDVAHDCKWGRHGASLLKRTIDSLVAVGELEWALTSKKGSEKTDHKRVLVAWNTEGGTLDEFKQKGEAFFVPPFLNEQKGE
jgi:hypothetical protein